MRNVLCIALTVAAGLTTGCADFGGGIRFYQPLVKASRAPSEVTYFSARDLVTRLGGRIVDEGTAPSRFTAVVAEDDKSRDHLMVTVDGDDQVAVSFYTEVPSASGWVRSDVVCSTYSYTRERMMLDLIVDIAGATVVASR